MEGVRHPHLCYKRQGFVQQKRRVILASGQPLFLDIPETKNGQNNAQTLIVKAENLSLQTRINVGSSAFK